MAYSGGCAARDRLNFRLLAKARVSAPSAMLTARVRVLCAVAAVAQLLPGVHGFSAPLRMAQTPVPMSEGRALGRRDAMGAVLSVVGVQLAAASLLPPSRSYEQEGNWMMAALKTTRPRLTTVSAADEALSENEVYKVQRRLRKVSDNLGTSEMEQIAEAMGVSFRCMESDLCRRTSLGFADGYE